MFAIRSFIHAAAVAVPLALVAAPAQAQADYAQADQAQADQAQADQAQADQALGDRAYADDAQSDQPAAAVIGQLGDPGAQQAIAQTLAVLSEALLDLPLAPLARAAAQAAGEDPDVVDPQMTLRQIAPEAEDVPEQLTDRVPQVMGAMAGMAEGMQAMLPALRQMAERVNGSLAASAAERD